jgi:tRNA(fMet)-specific endonuclease VapC
MSLFILDTDHFTLYRFGQEAVTRRVETVSADQLAITIITIEEQLTGWYTQLRQARNAEKLTRAYEGLFQVTEAIRQVRVLPFRAAAVQGYLAFRKQLPRLGKLDLAIAAIVLEEGGVLVTRNRSDFAQVLQLHIEDWSTPPSKHNSG